MPLILCSTSLLHATFFEKFSSALTLGTSFDCRGGSSRTIVPSFVVRAYELLYGEDAFLMVRRLVTLGCALTSDVDGFGVMEDTVGTARG